MALILEDISYSTDSFAVLKNINMNIKFNNVTGIVGKSGSGKTTLLEVIDTLTIPQSGKVTFINENYQKKIKVGMVFQFCEEQFFCNTVEKEIEFGLNYKSDKSKNKKRVLDSLRMVCLPLDYLKRNPFTLSNGEKRKVALACVLALNPDILILDEPTIGLDTKNKEWLIQMIKLLKNRYDKTVIISSSDIDFIHQVCDDVFVINDGEILLSGNKYEVFANDISKYGLKDPKIIEFEKLAFKQKGIKLLYRDDINDLMKDVYRSVK